MGLRDGPRVAEGHTPGASYQKAKGGCAKTTISCESQVSLAISWFISRICGARPYGKTSPFISRTPLKILNPGQTGAPFGFVFLSFSYFIFIVLILGAIISGPPSLRKGSSQRESQ